MSNAKSKPLKTVLPNHFSQVARKQSPVNLTRLNAETGARDLNARLQEMDHSLQKLTEDLGSSHHSLQDGFEQMIGDVKDEVQNGTEEVRSQTKNAQTKLGYLEGSYQNLEKKSESLAKETTRLALLLDKNFHQHEDSVNSLKENSNEHFNQISQQIDTLDQQVNQLVEDYKTLSQESKTLINDVSAQTSNLAQNLSDHKGDFKKLAQVVETQNKKVDSRLEQVSHNFSFHDAKIIKLYEKELALENQSQTLKDLLFQAETEQKHEVIRLEKNLESKITSVSDTADQKHQTLSDEHNDLTKRTSEIESRTVQLDEHLQVIDDKHLEQYSEHEERLIAHGTHLHHHEARLKQLNSVDEELTHRAEGLKETTQKLNEHSQVLEKTTVSLQGQSHELNSAVLKLNEQNEHLEEKTEQIGSLIVANAQTERHHFQSMTMAVSFVAILTIVALIYSFINQQSLWQSSIDNDVALEHRINMQLSEQQTQLLQADQQRRELIETVAVLQKQLSEEQLKANDLVKASQEKSRKIVQLKGDLKEMDDNVKFLNTSVGPLRDYTRFSGNQSLLDESWLAQQPGEHYSIQLVSVDSKQKLYEFVEKNGYSFQDDLAWFTINAKGKDYYILTYGSFNELVQARAALSQLPSILVAQSPGIARLSDIQTFIN